MSVLSKYIQPLALSSTSSEPLFTRTSTVPCWIGGEVDVAVDTTVLVAEGVLVTVDGIEVLVAVRTCVFVGTNVLVAVAGIEVRVTVGVRVFVRVAGREVG